MELELYQSKHCSLGLKETETKGQNEERLLTRTGINHPEGDSESITPTTGPRSKVASLSFGGQGPGGELKWQSHGRSTEGCCS